MRGEGKEKVTLNLAGLDGNAFVLLGTFARAARRQGWPQERIHEVLEEARRADYDHLLRTLLRHTEPGETMDDGREDPSYDQNAPLYHE